MTLDGRLRHFRRTLTPDEFARLRAFAFASGTVMERDGLTVLGFGEAATIRLPSGLSDDGDLRAARESLALIEPADPPTRGAGGAGATRRAGDGAHVLCMAALPFLPDAAATLVVPSVSVLSRYGEVAVATVIGDDPGQDAIDRLLEEHGSFAPQPPPDSFVLESTRPHSDFLERVAAAVEEVRSGRLDKVVIAREVRVEGNRPLRQGDLLERLRSLHPSCLTFAIGGFIGATPELLLRRRGAAVESHPLAGTAARSGDAEADRRVEEALLGSEKERKEHRAVVDAIANGLGASVAELDVGDVPKIVELRNVSHLGTEIRGTLKPDAVGNFPNALEVLSLIHPTPAVAGTPVDLALEYLQKCEELERDRYAGAVGWMDASGDGEWHLGIRCAIVEDRTARLFAGVGIVADSDPAAELAETQLKLQAFLAAAVRP